MVDVGFGKDNVLQAKEDTQKEMWHVDGET